MITKNNNHHYFHCVFICTPFRLYSCARTSATFHALPFHSLSLMWTNSAMAAVTNWRHPQMYMQLVKQCQAHTQTHTNSHTWTILITKNFCVILQKLNESADKKTCTQLSNRFDSIVISYFVHIQTNVQRKHSEGQRESERKRRRERKTKNEIECEYQRKWIIFFFEIFMWIDENDMKERFWQTSSGTIFKRTIRRRINEKLKIEKTQIW